MEAIEFWKMNGSGNDFILIDNMDGKVAAEDMGRVGERVCRRRESVGFRGFTSDSGLVMMAPFPGETHTL